MALQFVVGVARFGRYPGHADTIDNLLARDAKADTVTLRRESLEALLPVNRSYAKGHCIQFPEKPLVLTAIAEAEAALAKGGE